MLSKLIFSEFQRNIAQPFKFILSYQGLGVAIAALKQKHDAEGKVFDCLLIKYQDFKEAMLQLQAQKKSQIIVIQFVSNKIPHYACLHAGFDQKITRCLALDASNTDEFFPGFLRKLRTFFHEVHAVIGSNVVSKLQIDTVSCPFYALDHAIKIHNITNLYAWTKTAANLVADLASLKDFSEENKGEVAVKYLSRLTSIYPENEEGMEPPKNKQYFTFWHLLPPLLVSNMQSLSAAKRYRTYHEANENHDSWGQKLHSIIGKQTKEIKIRGTLREANLGIVMFAKGLNPVVSAYIEEQPIEKIATLMFAKNAPLGRKLLDSIQKIWPELPADQVHLLREKLYAIKLKDLKRMSGNVKKISSQILIAFVQSRKLDITDVLMTNKVNDKFNLECLGIYLKAGLITGKLILSTPLNRLSRLKISKVQEAIVAGEVGLEEIVKSKSFEDSADNFGIIQASSMPSFEELDDSSDDSFELLFGDAESSEVSETVKKDDIKASCSSAGLWSRNKPSKLSGEGLEQHKQPLGIANSNICG
jgi:hypothetical protein